MRRVYFADNSMIAHHVKALLKEAGIHAEVTGDTLAMGIAVGPADISVKPGVWVGDEKDYARALEIVREYEASAAEAGDAEVKAEPWTCAACGETCDANFAVCWNCGAERAAS